ncbi:MAG TPA: hypothetical protein VLC09_15780 [Polyangiaceae bacterium]|nr:hypothetical protein [Polyangiaceae bacterium]
MRTIWKILVAGLALSSAACTTQARSVTHMRVAKDKAYIAYAEWDEGLLTGFTGSNDRSRVKRCEIAEDNSMKCEEDADINRLLNPQEQGAAPAPAAPAEAAPAESAPAPEGEQPTAS